MSRMLAKKVGNEAAPRPLPRPTVGEIRWPYPKRWQHNRPARGETSHCSGETMIYHIIFGPRTIALAGGVGIVLMLGAIVTLWVLT